MKVIKLDKRYRAFKQHGHTVGLRFEIFSSECSKIENHLYDLTGDWGWRMQSWTSFFLKKPQYGVSPYLITIKDESLLTAILLKK